MTINESTYIAGRDLPTFKKETAKFITYTFGINAITLKASTDKQHRTHKFQLLWKDRSGSKHTINLVGLSTVQILDHWKEAVYQINTSDNVRISYTIPSIKLMTKWLKSMIRWINKDTKTQYRLKGGILFHKKIRSHTITLADSVSIRPELREGQFASMLLDFSKTTNGSRVRKRLSFTTYDQLVMRWQEVIQAYKAFSHQVGIEPESITAPTKLEWHFLIQNHSMFKEG